MEQLAKRCSKDQKQACSILSHTLWCSRLVVKREREKHQYSINVLHFFLILCPLQRLQVEEEKLVQNCVCVWWKKAYLNFSMSQVRRPQKRKAKFHFLLYLQQAKK